MKYNNKYALSISIFIDPLQPDIVCIMDNNMLRDRHGMTDVNTLVTVQIVNTVIGVVRQGKLTFTTKLMFAFLSKTNTNIFKQCSNLIK